ncbi:hypothetical protein DER44DRAFT_747899 [Fusarium oxysporum]|nr:hypothetical protein DER44DRAFT_747899 [Fusarium oxysporum]
MGPNNADIFPYVSSLPARQTVLKDAHEVFKATITTQDCSWEEKFLRNIEFNTLGISEEHILNNTNHKEVRAYVTIMESTNEFRQLNSQPDFIYGWIPPQYMIDNHEIPAWSKVEAGAVDGENPLYPFLVVKFDGPDNEQRENLHETAHNCIQGGSISVRMVERLRHRLAERGGNIPGLYSSVFSFVLNRTTGLHLFQLRMG